MKESYHGWDFGRTYSLFLKRADPTERCCNVALCQPPAVLIDLFGYNTYKLQSSLLNPEAAHGILVFNEKLYT